MRNRRRLPFLALLLCLCLALTPLEALADDDFSWAVQQRDAQEEAARIQAEGLPANMIYGDLTLGYVAGEGAWVNPLMCTERDLVSLNQLVFESVVDLDENMRPVPLLADNWTVEDKTWVFKLRSGIVFHSGEELEAADVVATYDMLKQTSEENPYSARLKMIEGMAAGDAHTLIVQAKYSGMITLYAMVFPVIQRYTLTSFLPRGTGPYWYINYVQDTAVRLERNALWWKQQPNLASVVAVRFPDTASALEALQTDRIDTFGTRSASAALSRRLSDLSCMDYPTCTYEALIPNLSSSSPMGDKRVRKAVMYAIDRNTLVENAYLGMAQQSEVPVLPGSWIYQSQSAMYNYSPERALQLLYDAGWANLTDDVILSRLNENNMIQDLRVSIVTYDESKSSVRSNAAQQIAANLNAIGFKASVRVLSKDSVLRAIRNRDYDLALVSMNLSEVPNLTALFSGSGNLNLSGYSSSRLDALLGATGTSVEEDEFIKAFSDLQLFVAEELPMMGLLFRTGTLLSSRSLGGLTGIRESAMLRGLEFVGE